MILYIGLDVKFVHSSIFIHITYFSKNWSFSPSSIMNTTNRPGTTLQTSTSLRDLAVSHLGRNQPPWLVLSFSPVPARRSASSRARWPRSRPPTSVASPSRPRSSGPAWPPTRSTTCSWARCSRPAPAR